ncbi:synapsin II [Pelomyxa schiedti]|nr:synapsin II [Pelomyxa schiedti]
MATTATTATASSGGVNALKPKKLLAVVGTTENWYRLGKDMVVSTPLGEVPVEIEQATWDDITCCCYSDSGIELRLGPSKTPLCEQQKNVRRFIPDFIIVRNFCRSVGGRLGSKPDFRNTLMALYYAGIPMMNSFQALYAELERPIMYAALLSIAKRLGHNKFPLIPQIFYPDHSEMNITPSTPFVVKVSYPHAGFGKMLIQSTEDFQDLSGVIGLHKDYCTAEPFIESEYELRIIKIGNTYRAHKRMGSSWKVNAGASCREPVPMEERYKLWVDEASKIFGGLDLLALDAIVDKNGKEYILEVNGSALGLSPEHETENLIAIRDLVQQRMSELFTQKPLSPNRLETLSPSPTASSLETTIVNLKNELATALLQVEEEKAAYSQLERRLENERAKHKNPSHFIFPSIPVLLLIVIAVLIPALIVPHLFG